VDDVKAYLPDWTTDLSYLDYRELLLPLRRMGEAGSRDTQAYAWAHNLLVRNHQFDLKGSQVGIPA
jgi:hypothetical protein